jgi:hypothetical protein
LTWVQMDLWRTGYLSRYWAYQPVEWKIWFQMLSMSEPRTTKGMRVDGPGHRLGCPYTWNRSEIRHHTADPQEIRMAEVDLCIPPQDRWHYVRLAGRDMRSIGLVEGVMQSGPTTLTADSNRRHH